jgi:RNA polymerase sigma factor (sigma-70 family)
LGSPGVVHENWWMSNADVLRPTPRPRAVPLRLRSDDRLARQAASGDTDAFAALYQRHHRALYRYCRSIVGDPDDAADALQSAMTRALGAIGGRDQRAPVRAWLFRIAHNESISLIRGRPGAEPLDPESMVGPDVEADAERRRGLAQLVTDLQALPERQRGALLMRELSGLGHAEIAAAFEISQGAVKQAIYEARTALHDFARGREMDCAVVQRQLSDGDGRTARSRRLRAHLRSCEACSAFRADLRSRRSQLAAITPVLPAATAAAVLESVIGGGTGGGLLAALSISKTVVVGAATVTAGAGAITFTTVAPEERTPRRVAPPAAEASPGGPDKPPTAAAAVAPADEARDRPAKRTEAPVEEPRVVAVRPERRAQIEAPADRAEPPAGEQEEDTAPAPPLPVPEPIAEVEREEPDDDEEDVEDDDEPEVVPEPEPDDDDKDEEAEED